MYLFGKNVKASETFKVRFRNFCFNLDHSTQKTLKIFLLIFF